MRLQSLAAGLLTSLLAFPLRAAEPADVRIETSDGRTLTAHLYEPAPGDTTAAHAVVLAHGGVFDKESWAEQAAALVEAGLTALAFDFRGYGDGEPTYGVPGKRQDVLAAIDFLAARGFERISLVGGSMGGQFSIAAAAVSDRVDLLVLLAPGAADHAADIRARSILVITAEGDRLRAEVDRAYREAPEPKRLEVFPGDAHAQHIFATEQGPAVTALMVEFLASE